MSNVVTATAQPSLFAATPDVAAVAEAVKEVLRARMQPSAWELIERIDKQLGLKARWAVVDAIRGLLDDNEVTNAQKSYLRELLESHDWTKAIRGIARPGREIESTVDALLRESAAYRNTKAFQEMVGFMANFRDYAPFNNMLIKLQRPSCSFFATQSDWQKRFGRVLTEDAKPMIILAPMHPVMLVYDLDSTTGPPLPKSLEQFAKFDGEWDTKRLERTLENAKTRDLIRVDQIELSSTNAGFATISTGAGGMKMRIALHNRLDAPSKYGVLLHELAHIYLGHLGGDRDGWWPSRGDLDRRAMEVEAEAVAYIASRRAGLSGSSAQYVCGYLKGDAMLGAVSLDLIAKVAGRLEEMGARTLEKRRPKVRKASEGVTP